MNEMTKVSSEDTLANAVGDTTVACTFNYYWSSDDGLIQLFVCNNSGDAHLLRVQRQKSRQQGYEQRNELCFHVVHGFKIKSLYLDG